MHEHEIDGDGKEKTKNLHYHEQDGGVAIHVELINPSVFPVRTILDVLRGVDLLGVGGTAPRLLVYSFLLCHAFLVSTAKIRFFFKQAKLTSFFIAKIVHFAYFLAFFSFFHPHECRFLSFFAYICIAINTNTHL